MPRKSYNLNAISSHGAATRGKRDIDGVALSDRCDGVVTLTSLGEVNTAFKPDDYDRVDNCDTDHPTGNGELERRREGTSDGGVELPGPDQLCGYGSCNPHCLQATNNSKALLAVLCWFVFIQSYHVNGVNNVNLTTLERRFDLKSKQVAWLSSSYEISAGILCIIVGYVGTFVQKGRLLAIMAAVMATGSFVMVLPHIFDGEYELGVRTADDCNIHYNQTCLDDNSSDSNYLYIFILGMVLVGFGGAGAYILGIPWLDENIDIEKTPIYIGTVQAFAAIGPAVGFLAGGAFLNIFVDIGSTSTNNVMISPNDRRWVGAWWIAYLIAAAFGLLAAFLLGCFPNELPGKKELDRKRESQAYKGSGDAVTSAVNFGKSWQDIGYSLKLLFCNPPWILLTIAGTVESGAVGSFAIFMPKVLQFQFGMSSSNAAIIVGALLVPGAVIGQVIGGVIPNRLKSKVRGLIIQCCVCSLIGIVCSFGFLLRCRMPPIAGVTNEYLNRSILLEESSLINTCNSVCGCTTTSYEPVCGSDDIEYFSPCHAACHSSQILDDTSFYYDCSCVQNNDIINTTEPWDAKEGNCITDCGMMYYFFPIFFVLVLVTFISATAGNAATIRVVPDKSRSFGYGLQFAIVRFVGNVPGPVLFGTIFDNQCLVWQEKCTVQGACWVYDNEALAKGLCIISVVAKGTSALMLFLAAVVYRSPDTKPHSPDIAMTPDVSYTNGKADFDETQNPENITEITLSSQTGERQTDVI